MKPIALALAASALALGAPPAEAADKRKPFIATGEPCGRPQELYLCATVRGQQQHYLNGAQFRFPGKGKVQVTWLGQVFCDVKDVDGGSPPNSVLEYYVHFNVSEGEPFQTYNEPGAASVGERLNVRATTTDVVVGRTLLTQVTLSKTFAITEKGSKTFRTFAYGDFRTAGAGSFCNVNGGAYTVSYVPD